MILDYESSIPLYIQIYNRLKEDILSGAIPEGGKLPSTRSLSASLKVSRNTVESAYLQLCSEGYAAARKGSGYRAEKLDGELFQAGWGQEPSMLPDPVEQPVAQEPETEYRYDFRYGVLSGAHFPIKLWRRISNRCLAEIQPQTLAGYGHRKGLLEFRQEIQKHLLKSRGVRCSVDQILVTTGIDHSLSLLCQLVREWSTDVALEDPGFIWARHIFGNNGFRVHPVGLDKDGIRVEELEQLPAQMVYVTPSHQFPTGAVMPIQRRMQLLDWAHKRGGVIIEDDYDSELRYNTRPIPSIQSIDPYGCVIYTGTFSKSLSPSLRVSYMALPEEWARRFNQRFSYYQCPVSVIQQHIIRQFMQEGHWERHLRLVNHVYKSKHDLLTRMLQEELAEEMELHGRNAGIHLLLESKSGRSEQDLIGRARAMGVRVEPVSPFWMRRDSDPGNRVLLGFGALSEKDIAGGVRALRQAWL